HGIRSLDQGLGIRSVSPVTWDQALRMPAEWYAGAEAVRIAETVRLYQRASGGWPKNIDMAAPLSDTDRARLISERGLTDSTIDNGSTTAQIRYLARVHAATGDDRL